MAALVNLFLYLLIVGVIIGLLLYVVSISPIPEPFKGWLWWVVIVIAIFAIIYFLLGMIGGGGGAPHVSLPNWH
jgi:hypothetical protein